MHVPFGVAIVFCKACCRFSEGIDDNISDLKAICEVLDFEPVLNEEQLALADQMRHTVFSYKISILKSMIPNLLNSTYDKRLVPTDKLSDEERLALFGDKDSRLHSGFI